MAQLPRRLPRSRWGSDLLGPWALYVHQLEGKTLAEHFLESPLGRQIPAADRKWLEAQRESWLSSWEVEAVEPATGTLRLRDLLTGLASDAQDFALARSAVVHDVLLARVVDCGGSRVPCGLYPRSLSPIEAEAVAAKARARLERKSSVAPENLRPIAIARLLLQSWEEAVDARYGLSSQPHEPALDPNVKRRIEQQFLEQYYANWLDEPVPALGDLTPRQAARREPGRERLVLLSKDMERMQAVHDHPFDFGRLRIELGLPAA